MQDVATMTAGVEDVRRSSPDPRKRVRLLKRLAGRFAADGTPLVPQPDTDDGAPLSFPQQQLWLLDRIDPGKPTYNIVGSAYFRGPLDLDAFVAAVNEIIRRHEALRTVYRKSASGPVQIVLPFSPLHVPVVDLTRLPQRERDPEARRLADLEAQRPFDLETGPVVRAQFLKLEPEYHAFLLTFHHIATDAWSMSIFTDELALQYEALLSGTPADLPPLAVRYTDFARWQRQVVAGTHVQDQIAYWKAKLSGAPSELELPTDRPRPPVPSHAGRRRSFDISADLVRDVKALGKRNGATLFTTLLTAFYALLARYSGQDDIVVGTPNAGRNRPEIADLMGYFVNTLALRVDCSGDPTFAELLGRVKTAVQEGYEHADAPFERVIEAVAPERTVASPLVGVMFALEESFGTWSFVPGIEMTPLNADIGAAIGDLMLWCVHKSDGVIDTQFEYSTDLFDDATIERAAAHFRMLLASAVRDPATPISRLELLEAAERDAILAMGRGPQRGPEVEGCVHERFADQAARTPQAVAVTDGDTSLTYRELDERANRVAAQLATSGAGPGQLVGLYVGRSLDAIVAMLGILKTGAAYLPLDPEYPSERIGFMLQDARVSILCAESTRPDGVPDFDGAVVDVRAAALETSYPTAAVATGRAVSPEDPAYVIYTSGSTGRPKGVVALHRAVTNLVIDTNYVGIGTNDTIAQLATLSFDAATFEIWGPLLCGGRIVICPSSTMLSPGEFADFLARENVTVMFLTTALFHVIVRSQPGAFRGIRTLLVGGEQLDPQYVRAVMDAGPPHEIFNIYGPTETTTFACAYRIGALDDDTKRVPIGRPLAGVRTLVLDARRNIVPFGVPGELCIGGLGLARGYLDRPELTAERFIDDPIGGPPGSRLYRTGDRFRLLPTGDLDILGRFDNQVKIRGFRVELGEIETALRQQPGVGEAVVLTDGEGDAKRLLAFVVARGGVHSVRDSDLRTALSAKLPNYMVPSVITVVDRLPLTANGKIDARELLLQAWGPGAHVAAPPQNSLQHRLAAIWKEILGRQAIGIHDDFFEIGGNSLLAVRMLEEVERICGKRIPPAELFRTPTIKHLHDVLVSQVREKGNPPVIMLQETGTKTPFFLFHGAGVPAFYGRAMSKALGPNQPFFVLAPHGFEGASIPPTVEAMADDYLLHLRSIRPSGPYNLGGFCMSGLIAFESALRLVAAGEKIEHLCLIDTYPGGAGLTVLDWLLRRAESTGAIDLWRRQRILAAASRWRAVYRDAVHGGRLNARQVRHALRLRWTFNDILAADVGREKDRVYWLEAMARSYVPKRRYPGLIHLLASEQAMQNVPNDPTIGWKHLCTGVKMYRIPGLHKTIFTEHTDLVAEYLRSILQNDGSYASSAEDRVAALSA